MSDTIQTPELLAPNFTTSPLLLEIGCEEIPARFLAQAQKDLGERLHAALVEARLTAEESGVRSQEPEGGTQDAGLVTRHLSLVTAFSTPRRLVARAPAVLARQPDKTEELMGPPVKVAFDAAGTPTRAAESFAQKNAADIKDLIRVITPKGEYLALKKTTPGRPALEVLSEILPSVITGMSFPKSMYWEASKTRFVRPIRWIVALVGEGESVRVIPFEVAGVRSGNQTSGHRLAGSTGILVTGYMDYVSKLRAAYVETDPQVRRQKVQREVRVLLEDSLQAVPDQDLEEWIVNSTEWLSGIRGSFDHRFLRLPREILVTVMRDHQKYFAVENSAGELQPRFVTILNREGDPTGVVRAGHERVLTARFSDAEFFWNADQKIPLRDRLPMLDRVTYQAKLGSYGDKIGRMGAIARQICRALEGQGRMTASESAHALRAVQLCKCDLTTQMVQEFTELQGIVGGLYAKAQGEPQEVADAIYDHYLPQCVEDGCPRSLLGAVVSLSDKIDSVVAGFAAGLEPTGSSDPFGIRRQGNGVVRVLAELSLPIIVTDLVMRAIEAFEKDRRGLLDPIWKFFEDRMRFYLETVAECRYDTARAVIAVGWDIPVEAVKRARALERIRDTEDYVALSVAAKRARNILLKSAAAEDYQSGSLDPNLLQEDAELQLYKAYGLIFGEATEGGTVSRDYDTILTMAARLRPMIDRFFDDVLVIHEDPAIRRNRLRLLALLKEKVFSRVADLSQIESPTLTLVDASTSKTVASDK
jgi:glycyl-tRNA synthetase beta chain